MNKHILIKLILVFSLTVPTWSQAETTPENYSQLYVFGNSLSDTGNLASVVGNLPYPFYFNRISNGPVAVEILAARLGLTVDASLHVVGPAIGSNYAVASADAFGNKLQDLSTQITLFHANHGFVAPSTALYVMFIGGNDILHTRRLATDEEAHAAILAAVDSINTSMQSLILAGAKRFLLVNSPNAALLPAILSLAEENNDPELVERMRKYSKFFRNKLHALEENLEEAYPVNITEFDLFKHFNKIVKKADDYGFSNSTEACFSRDPYSFHPDCNFGLSFDQFIFFDEIHPTAKVHQIIGDAMYQTMTNEEDN